MLQHSVMILSPFPDIELGRENGVRNAILVSIISEDKALQTFHILLFFSTSLG